MIQIGKRPRQTVQMTAPDAPIEWREITETELTIYQVSWHDLVSKSRLPHIVSARWSIWRRLSDEMGATAYGMAPVFGVHHTTILYGLGRLNGKTRVKR